MFELPEKHVEYATKKLKRLIKQCPFCQKPAPIGGVVPKIMNIHEHSPFSGLGDFMGDKIPVMISVCKHCGLLNIHSAVVLGVLEEVGDEQGWRLVELG